MEYFVFSDCHGFYTELIRDLTSAGYDKNNENHHLIVCGDIFDRGTQPLEIYNFLRSIPKERRTLIRGNHEILLKDLVARGYAESHDIHNGTLDTLYYLHELPSEKEYTHDFYRECTQSGAKWGTALYKQIQNKYESQRREIWSGLVKEIIDWIDSDEWVNYYETKDYIFVHSWVPVQEYIDWEKSMSAGIIIKSDKDSYREDWRNATQQEWNDAMWGCPWKKAKAGLNKTDKTIVCGHWHTSDFYNNLKNKNCKKKYTINENPIYESKRYKLIGLDTCTSVTKKINIFTFEE